jgi:hypothetical protein
MVERAINYMIFIKNISRIVNVRCEKELRRSQIDTRSRNRHYSAIVCFCKRL